MDMDQAAVFLSGSILYCLGFLVILCTVVIANNVVSKFWKSWGWSLMPRWMEEPPQTFMTQEEYDRHRAVDKTIEPKMK